MKRYSIKVNGKVFDVEVEERNAAATAASVSAESADEAKDTDSRDAADAGERAVDTGAKAAAEKRSDGPGICDSQKQNTENSEEERTACQDPGRSILSGGFSQFADAGNCRENLRQSGR